MSADAVDASSVDTAGPSCARATLARLLERAREF